MNATAILAEEITIPRIKIEKIRYQSDESNWKIVVVKVLEGRNFEGGHLTVRGNLPDVAAGDEFEITVTENFHEKFGTQYEVISWGKPIPTDEAGIHKFLLKNFTGIGKKRATNLIQEFGSDVINVLERKNAVEVVCDRLLWSRQTTEKLVEQWQKAILPKRIEFLLLGAGLTNKQISRLKETCGDGFAETLGTNPYSITKVSGIGFLTADKFALKKGIAPDDRCRIWAAAEYVLKQSAQKGNCFMQSEEIGEEIGKLLRISREAIIKCLTGPIPPESNAVRDADGDWWNHNILTAEKRAATYLISLIETSKSKSSHLTLEEWEEVWTYFQLDSGIILTEEQKAAVRAVLFEKVIIITGNPGTGKTTILKAILAAFDFLGTREMSLCAPTGKAARRMSEATDRETSTIHRLLNLSSDTPSFSHLNPLPADVVAVDEASMIDIELFSLLVSAVKRSAQLILIGDADQLPSVGPGRVLGDLMDAGIAHIRLTQPQRQAESSYIVKLAHEINHGRLPLLPTADSPENVWFYPALDKNEARRSISEVFAGLAEKGIGYDRVKVLSPQKKGECGVFSLNTFLQEKINPAESFKAETSWGSGCLRTDDKLIQLNNNYQLDLMNGEDLTVTGIIREEKDQEFETAVELSTDDGKEYTLPLSELNMQLSYALTIHKSQGSEWDVVVLFCLSEQLGFYSRRMLYTGLTRAKKLAIIIGDRESLRKVIGRNYETRRKTKFTERIDSLWKQR